MVEWLIFCSILLLVWVNYVCFSEVSKHLIEIKERQRETCALLEDNMSRAINILNLIRYDAQPEPPPGSNDDPRDTD